MNTLCENRIDFSCLLVSVFARHHPILLCRAPWVCRGDVATSAYFDVSISALRPHFQLRPTHRRRRKASLRAQSSMPEGGMHDRVLRAPFANVHRHPEERPVVSIGTDATRLAFNSIHPCTCAACHASRHCFGSHTPRTIRSSPSTVSQKTGS